MSTLEIRPATAADLPAITEIYDHAVRHGTATFELTPPDLAEMSRRFGVLRDGGYPYLAAASDGRVVGYAYAGAYRPRPAYRFTVENSIYLQPAIHRRGIGMQLLQRLIAEVGAARLSPDDRGDRRLRQCRIDRRAHQMRVPDDRNASRASASSSAAGSTR